jgi:hypothetical protein
VTTREGTPRIRECLREKRELVLRFLLIGLRNSRNFSILKRSQKDRPGHKELLTCLEDLSETFL